MLAGSTVWRWSASPIAMDRFRPSLTRLLPTVAGLVVAGVGTAAQASALPLMQVGTVEAVSAAHTSGGLHGHLFLTLWELGNWVEPHHARPCGGFGHIALLGVVALVLVAALRFRYAASAQRIDLARRMVERGMMPPDDIFSSSSRNDLRRGLVLLGAGAGLLAYGFASNPDTPSVAGLIPSFIGIGYLLSHRFARGSRP